MTVKIHRATLERLLVISSPEFLPDVLGEHANGRKVAALLSTPMSAENLEEFDPVILALLRHDCEYFVCFGAGAEVLHDRIDDLVVENVRENDRSVITTWHDDETSEEVAEFFFNIAGAKPGALLVALLSPDHAGMEGLLVQQAARS